MTGLEVRLASERDGTHRLLFEVPWDADLDGVIESLKGWGVTDEGGWSFSTLTGDFRISPNARPYFLIWADNGDDG